MHRPRRDWRPAAPRKASIPRPCPSGDGNTRPVPSRASRTIKRGHKRTRDPRDQELEHLRREVERLSRKLGQAELIIDIQEKVAAMLGHPIETPPNSEATS